jgi:DNA (cytosine-5)-methyltransferase 1
MTKPVDPIARDGIATIELFAGAGGLGLGARQAGADVRLLLDSDPLSCATLRENEQHIRATIVEGDISAVRGQELREIAKLSRSDRLLVTGGPPCQPFSKAAYWTDPGDEARYRRARSRGDAAFRPTDPPPVRPDSRRSLVGEFWRLVRETGADMFLMENVPSILHPRNRGEVTTLVDAAEEAGFHVRVVRANSIDFGVPQRRQRVFVLGDKVALPRVPRATHGSGEGLLPVACVGDALESFGGSEFFEPREQVTGRWAEHLRVIPPGWNYKFHTAWANHPEPTFVTETRFWNFLLKLHPERPSWTIPANPGPWTGPFHWDGRRLRVPELAAVQGFPADYFFVGSRREQVRQIGNAVPPSLAAAMVRSLLGAADCVTLDAA